MTIDVVYEPLDPPRQIGSDWRGRQFLYGTYRVTWSDGISVAMPHGAYEGTISASRVAKVLVSQGRIEIVLVVSDPDWVWTALSTIQASLNAGQFQVVVADPSPREDDDGQT